MIDLTPLDVRNKRSDFKKVLRGYDPQEVDVFLEMVAERLEAVVRENIQLSERSQLLQQQVSSSSGRERAVQEALVTAQELRADIRAQALREAELVLQEAQAEARRRLEEVERKRAIIDDSLVELERRRMRFLKNFRQLLEREMDGVEVEEGRAPLEEHAIEMHLGGGRPADASEPDVEAGELLDDRTSEDAFAAPEEDAFGRRPPAEDMAGEAPDTGREYGGALAYGTDDPGEDRVPWDSPVHDLARRHVEEAEGSEAPPLQRGGGLFSLPDLPALEDSDDTGRP